MVNEGRTLLANQVALNNDFSLYIAEEFTPPEFVPVVLPSYVERIRATLFGFDPDRSCINYRCRQFLTILHRTRWVEYLVALDSRFTYRTGDTAELVPATRFGATITQVAGSAPTPLTVIGFPAPPDPSGKLKVRYTVTVLTPNSVSISRQTMPAFTQIIPFTMTDGLSNLLPLGSSGYNVRLTDNSADLSYVVDLFTRPQWDIGTLLANVDEVNKLDVIELLTGEEPYQTFLNLWQQPKLPDRLAGLILGLIYQTKEAWRLYCAGR
jgi:hypothetical protein